MGRLELNEAELALKYSKGASDEKYRELPLRRSGSSAQREDRPYMYYPFLFNTNTGELTVLPENEYVKIYDGSVFNDHFVEQIKSQYEKDGYEFILPIREDGSKGRWRWGYKSSVDGAKNGILFAKGAKSKTVYQIDHADSSYLPKSLWYGEKYDASTKGTNFLKNMIGKNEFDYPKSIFAVEDMLKIASTGSNDIILDFFAGSGTTGHAVININRNENRAKSYILVEMGEYFERVTRPRVLKSSYSGEYKDQKPVSRDGISQVVKYMALEQYEDALDNLGLSKSETQTALLASNPTLNEQYMLGYMLDVESRGSQSLLNIDAFADPFAYTLRITRNDDTQVVNVDLIETFNYLLGLTIRTVDRDKSGIVTVTGKNSPGENCLIIWRNVSEIDNAKLDAWFGKRYSSKDFEFDAIYVNGDNNIENMKLADDHWKVRLIEAEFKRLMFDVQDV